MAGSLSGRDDWLAAVRDQMRRQRAELLQEMPPFNVWGLSSPTLYPCAIRSFERAGTGWEALTLVYGDPELAPPAVSVRSAVDHGRHDHPDLERALVDAGARGGVRPGRARITLSGQPREVDLVADGQRWAASLTAPLDVRLTVIGCGVAPELVWLVPVDDLSLYGRQDSDPWLAGLDPHRVLLERLLRRPQSPIALRRRHFRQWRQAIRAQSRLSERPPGVVLRDLVEHVNDLSVHAPWFIEPTLRRAALEETLRYVCCGHEVPSLPAQQAWRQWRDGQIDQGSWLQAWSRWSITTKDAG